MAKTGLRSSFELTTRTPHTKVNCEVAMTVDGRELPNMAVLGEALEAAVLMIQERVTESYKEVPARVADPVAAVQATVAHTGLANVANATPQVSEPSAPATVIPVEIPKVETESTESTPEPEPVPFGSSKPWDIGKATQ